MPGPEISIEWNHLLKDEGGFWDDVNGGFLPGYLVLAARRDKVASVHSEGVHKVAPMQECNEAGKKLLDLFWWPQASLWIQLARRFNQVCVAENTRRRSMAKFTEPLEALVEQGEPLKWRHHEISRAHCQGTAHRLTYVCLPAEDRQNANLTWEELGGIRRAKHSACVTWVCVVRPHTSLLAPPQFSLWVFAFVAYLFFVA